MIIGRVKNLTVEKCDNLIEIAKTFTYIKDDDFLSGIKSEINFYSVLESAIDIVIARDDNKKICLVSFITDGGYKAGMLSGYAIKEYRNRIYSYPCIKLAIDYYFEKYNFNRIDVAGRNSNRLSKLFVAGLGFKKIGIIPKFLNHNGIDEDYYYSIIEREKWEAQRKYLIMS